MKSLEHAVLGAIAAGPLLAVLPVSVPVEPLALVGGALVVGLALVAPVYAVFTAGVLYVHVVADLLRDGDIA